MSLSPEQKETVRTWVAAGDTLAAIQKRLSDEFKVSMTYMEVRFLVDDLGVELKNPVEHTVAPNADLSKARPAAPAAPDKKAGLFDRLKKAVGAGGEEESGEEESAPEEELLQPEEEAFDAPAAPGASSVKVDVDRIVRPGAVVSGSVTFSDGVTAKWALDQLGRLMLDGPKKGYQPSQADIQEFQRELTQQLRRNGF